ncbi:MAG: hypothetical protein JKX87_00560 [Cycloclasticus sp.]|nr:hypothetical protein [Cycloclasticus sp.]
MKKLIKRYVLAGFAASLLVVNSVYANEVDILSADLRNSSGDWWTTNVTIEHKDTGWEHYVDQWRVVDETGNVLGNRVLHHPHVDEQPFTRGTADINIPKGTVTIYIEAHDTVHGWSPNRLKIDMTQTINGYVRVNAD